MPASSGPYANNETIIYNYVINNLGLNKAAACGILANVWEESRFNPQASGDSGASYGLFQWQKSRRAALEQYCDRYSLDRGSVGGQLKFLQYELNTTETKALAALVGVANTSAGADTAGQQFCTLFERPSNASETAKRRGELATDYWRYYNTPHTESTKSVTLIGVDIVSIARAQKGNAYYKPGGKSPREGFDQAGLVYYCYNTAGYKLDDLTVDALYQKYKDSAKHVTADNISAGDLIFSKAGSSRMSQVWIATGNGYRILVSSLSTDGINAVQEIELVDTMGDDILRLVADTETTKEAESSVSTSTSTTTSSPDISSLLSEEVVAKINENLESVVASGYDAGYLYDLTNGGSFKFYIPDFSESAGANWSPVEISGRSVTIQAYKSTNSRKITVNLELYAGVGMYTTGDTVAAMHADANFLKSLEYPDYSNPIIRPPTTVLLILGSAIKLVGVVSGVNIDHLKPLDEQNRSMYLKVSFTVTQIANNPPDWRDIRDNTTSIANTMNVASVIGTANDMATTTDFIERYRSSNPFLASPISH